MLDDVRYRLRALFRRRAVESELRDELEAHVAHSTQQLVALGLLRSEAERRARVELGGLEPVKEACRDARGVAPLEAAVQDVRYATRALLARPTFTIVAVSTLALGLGLNAAVFTAVRSVLLRPLPFHEPHRLVRIGPDRTISNAELLAFQSRLRSFDHVAAFSPGWGVYVSGRGEPSHLEAARVSTNFFATLGVAPALGRDFRPGESSAGAWNVVMLSDDTWRTRYAADRDIIGRTLNIDGIAHVVVGIMPRGFSAFTAPVQIWLPLQIDPSSQFFTGQSALGLGRLRAGASAHRAMTELASLVPSIRTQFAFSDDYGRGLRLMDLRESISGSARGPLLAVFGATALIVLIAGANVGTLLLLRGAGREREIVLRGALGASRGRIVRLLLSESLVLSLGGAGLGLAAGALATRLMPRLLPAAFPRRDEIGMDAGVAIAVIAIALLVGLLFGIAPALLAGRLDAQTALRGGRTGDGGSRRGARLRSGLVVAEVALALVLSIGAGLMLRTVWRLYAVDIGFRADHVLTLRLEPDRARVSDPRQRPAYYGEILRRISEIPGVTNVGGSHHLPLSGFNWSGRIEIERRPQPETADLPRTTWRVVVGDYFETMGIPLMRGRLFDGRDTRDAPPVVMINDVMARRLWPDRDPLGERIRVGSGTRNDWATIVGIVGNVRFNALDAPIGNEMYRPILQQSQIFTHLAVRTRGDPLAALPAVRTAVRSVDAGAAISEVAPLADLVDRSIGERRAVTQLLMIFALVGAALGVMGIHGVVAFAVTQRTRELGIRAALGAQRRAIVLMLVSQGARLALAGIALGCIASVAASRSLSSLLFGVSASDPLTYAGLACGMVVVMLVASYIPARRALRIDPVIALRTE
jgi:putative ABC transport system permease protein